MKKLKSSLGVFRKMFARAITLRDIAEPLTSFDHVQPSAAVVAFIEARDFDVVGIREHGIMTGYVKRSEIEDGHIGASVTKFDLNQVLSDSDPLVTVLTALQSQKYVFVNVLGHVGGIVTRGDLQKAPVRLWLFGLVSLMEMQMLRIVRERYPNDSWTSALTDERVAAARRILEQRRKRNEGNDLADCLQIGDKGKIFLKDGELFGIMKFSSKESLETFFNDVRTLRDALAHGNDISSGKWSELAELVTKVELTLELLERTVVTPHIKVN